MVVLPPPPPATWWPGLLERVERRTGTPREGRSEVGASPVLVAVDGRAGSGKTDLARAAAGLLAGAGHPVEVVHLDRLYSGWTGLAQALPRLCDEVVAPLRSGRPGRYRSWDWHAGLPGQWVEVPLREVVVVEGVGVLASPCSRSFEVRLWLEAPAQVRRARALDRDGEVFAAHWQLWADQEDTVLADRAAEDAIVDSVTGRTTWRRAARFSPGGTD